MTLLSIGQAKGQRYFIYYANNENQIRNDGDVPRLEEGLKGVIWRWAEAKCQVKVVNWPISHLHSGSNSSHYLFKPWCAGDAVGWGWVLQVRTILEVVMLCDKCEFEGVSEWPLAMMCLPGWRSVQSFGIFYTSYTWWPSWIPQCYGTNVSKLFFLRLILVVLTPSLIFRRRLRAFGREASLPAEAATASPTT